MAQETLKELKYNGSKVIAEVARRDALGRIINTTYLTDVQIISEDEINTAFESVFGKNTTTTVKKLLDARKSARNLFSEYDGTSVDDIIKYNDTSNVTSMSNMFYNCYNLTTIPQLNTSKVIDMSLMFLGCNNLTKISMLNIGVDLDIHYCTKMEREALLEVLGNLKDLTNATAATLTLGSTLLAKLTDDDKLIATNKNWTLA